MISSHFPTEQQRSEGSEIMLGSRGTRNQKRLRPAVIAFSYRHYAASPAGRVYRAEAQRPPSGPLWLHEIKHDGFRVIARKNGVKVRLYSRPGNDLTYRLPLIVETLARLRPRSCIIDGEAVVCDSKGMVSFNHIRYRRHDSSAFLYAFDLIELNADDVRRDPLEVRKATPANIVARAI
jgi:ATP-dependent DNA ligase